MCVNTFAIYLGKHTKTCSLKLTTIVVEKRVELRGNEFVEMPSAVFAV
jgi:hypothetical protein